MTPRCEHGHRGDDETFATRLEGHLAGVDVVNLGVHGYGHDQMLLQLRESAAGYAPDVVVLGYAQWDDTRNLLSFRDYAKPRFELVGRELEVRGVPVPTPEEVLAVEPYRSKLLDLVEIAGRRLSWRLGTLKASVRALTDALVTAFADTTRAMGAQPLIVYRPTSQDLERGPARREREVADLCRTSGTPFLSLRDRFRRTLIGHERTTLGHWDPVEHDIAADEIAAFVVDHRLLDLARGSADPAQPR